MNLSWSLSSEYATCAALRTSVEVCDASGSCDDASAVLDPSSGHLGASGLSLIPGRRYISTVTYEGCAEDGVARTSVGFVCDETAPVVSAGISPVLKSTVDTASPGHASVHEGLTISWAGVFTDRESFLERAEVCFSVSQLAGPLSLCQPEDWLPVTGGATSYTVGAPLPTRLANSSAVVARVRQFNRVGHFAVAESAEVVLSAEKPTLSWIAIGDWTSTDREKASCALNRSSGVPVRWGASLGARNYLLEVCETDCGTPEDKLAVATLPYSEVGAGITTVRLPSISGGSGLRTFRLTVMDHAGLFATLDVACAIDDAPPPAGFLWLPGAAQLADGLYAIGPTAANETAPPEAGDRTVCFGGFGGRPSGISAIELSLCQKGNVTSACAAKDVTGDSEGDASGGAGVGFSDAGSGEAGSGGFEGRRVSDTGYFENGNPEAAYGRRASEDDATRPNATCVSDATRLMPSTAYDVTVIAESGAGLRSEIQLTIVYDTTPPEPRSSPAVLTAHTGGPSPTHQQSDCCLAASWEAAAEPESAVRGYMLCFAQGSDDGDVRTASGFDGDDQCVPLGNRTSALVANEGCDCPLASAAQWPTFLHPAPLAVTVANSSLDGSDTRISFVLVAENVLGMRAVFQEYSVAVVGAPEIGDVFFEKPSWLPAACDVRGGVDVVHPAGWPLSIRVPQLTSNSLSSIELCFAAGANGTPSCTMRMGALPVDDTVITTAALPAGALTLTLNVTSLSGLVSSLSWTVVADDTPPQIRSEPSLVSMQENDEEDSPNKGLQGYYAWEDQVACEWSAASDEESGIRAFEVALVSRVGRQCTEAHTNRTGGAVLQKHTVSCNVSKAIFTVALSHASAYRCVLWAINGAGLRSTRASYDFVVDSSSRKLQPFLTRVAIIDGTAQGQRPNVTYVSDFVLTLAIDVDLGTSLAMREFEQKQKVRPRGCRHPAHAPPRQPPHAPPPAR